MKKKTLWPAMIMIMASGGLWGQKVADKTDILLLPEWKQIYDAFVPDAAQVESLKNKAAELRVDVYFGYWCDDSKNHVPVFLKILDALALPACEVNFYEVEKKAHADQPYYVEPARVEKVPTFIFYVKDFEIGRIIENPKDSILADIMAIVL